MNYYIVTTEAGIKLAYKSKTCFRSAEEASKETGLKLKDVAVSSLFKYLAYKLRGY